VTAIDPQGILDAVPIYTPTLCDDSKVIPVRRKLHGSFVVDDES
jgi:hypothetical protein